MLTESAHWLGGLNETDLPTGAIWRLSEAADPSCDESAVLDRQGLLAKHQSLSCTV